MFDILDFLIRRHAILLRVIKNGTVPSYDHRNFMTKDGITQVAKTELNVTVRSGPVCNTSAFTFVFRTHMEYYF